MKGLDMRPQPDSNSPEQEGSGMLSKMRGMVEGGKEKVFSFARYSFLKTKEFVGQLKDQEEFDELLGFDFRDELKDNPPIAGVFYPEEELLKIKDLPKTARKEALTIFKEKLARQREALASYRVFVERSIEFNHDVPIETLRDLYKQFAAQYGFTGKQEETVRKLVSGYYENRRKVLDIRKQYPDDVALVNKLTGLNFDKSEIFDVSVGPMSIDIYTNESNAGRIYEKSEKPVPTFKYGGFATQSEGADSTYYIVINRDAKEHSGEKTREHEHEHQKNKLFRAVFERRMSDEEIAGMQEGYYELLPIEVKKEILEAFFSRKREEALEWAKDEIIACLQDRTPEQLYAGLEPMFFSQDEGPYDYLADVRNYKRFETDILYKEISRRTLFYEYKSIIEKAFFGIFNLMKEGNYSTQEAVALLADKPLHQWFKVSKRLLEQARK